MVVRGMEKKIILFYGANPQIRDSLALGLKELASNRNIPMEFITGDFTANELDGREPEIGDFAGFFETGVGKR